MAESPKFRFGAVILVTGALGALVWSVIYSNALAQDEFKPVGVPVVANPFNVPNSGTVPTANGFPMSGGPDGGVYPTPAEQLNITGIVPGGAPDPFAPSAGPMPMTAGPGPMSPPSVTPPSANPPSGPMGGSMGMMGMMMMGGRPGDQFQAAEREYAAQARELLKRYAAESNPHAQAEMKRVLRDSLVAQFDLQHRRRDEELQWIEKRVAELRAKLKRRADAVNTIVDRRLEQLISDVDGLGWGADDLPQDLFEMGSSPGSMMPGRGPKARSGMMGPGMGSGMSRGMGAGMGEAPPVPPNPRRPQGKNMSTPEAIVPELTPQPGAPGQALPAVPGLPGGAAPGAGIPLGAAPGSFDSPLPLPNDSPRTETTVQTAPPATTPPAVPEATAPIGTAPGAGPAPGAGIAPTNTPPTGF